MSYVPTSPTSLSRQADRKAGHFEPSRRLSADHPARRPALACPPMGWNSFDGYGVYLHEAAAWSCLQGVHERLQPHGYTYFVIDGGWHGEIERRPRSIYPAERHAARLHLDRFGLPEPSRSSFPNGLAPLIRETHQLGLKFGLHLMRGMARQAIQDNGRSSQASTLRAIALPERDCQWCPQNIGVDVGQPEGRQFYRDLIAKLSDWGVDFVKFDDITAFPDEIDAVMDAVESVAPHLVVSLSPGGDTMVQHAASYDRADLLRVTPDIWDDQESIDRGFDAMSRWIDSPLTRCHIDLDMIPFGKLMQMTPEDAAAGHQSETAFAGKGCARRSGFQPHQARTFIMQRAIFGSPLMAGGDPTSYLGHELKLLCDADLIACNQLGHHRQIDVLHDEESLMLISVQCTAGSGAVWVCGFNRSKNESIRASLPSPRLGRSKRHWRLSRSSESASLTTDPNSLATWIQIPQNDAALVYLERP